MVCGRLRRLLVARVSADRPYRAKSNLQMKKCRALAEAAQPGFCQRSLLGGGGLQLQDALVPFAKKGIEHVGVCAFHDLLPLLETRAAGRLPTEARSVIVCALPYFCGDFPNRNVARYAVCDDYHQTGGAILAKICAELEVAFPAHTFAAFIDISPIREVKAAQLAGLGGIGRHGLLILPGYGSYVFVGCIVTDLILPASASAPGLCLQCGKCQKACPTGALDQDGLRRECCRSYITQKRGVLTPWEEGQLRAGRMAVGCDLCQQACPLNREAPVTPLAQMRKAPLPHLSLESLDEALGRKAYGYLGRKTLARNLMAIGN